MTYLPLGTPAALTADAPHSHLFGRSDRMTVIERERVVTERERRARVLEAAALEIEVRGWTQGRCQAGDGRVCAFGALNLALGYDALATHANVLWPSEDVWGETGFEVFGIPDPANKARFYRPLPYFNDVVARSAEDVTFAFRWRACEIRDGR